MQIREKTTKPPDFIESLAEDIVTLVLKKPPLLLPFREVIFYCKSPDDTKTIRSIIYPLETVYPLEAAQLKNYLIQYYTYTDSTWTLDKRRGYIFEELVFAIGPEGFKGPCTSDYESHRNVRFYNDCGQTICGNHDLDIVFKSKTSLLGAECKVKLSNWLYFANRITSNAQRKLDFMKCVLFASKKVGFHSTQCLVTLEEKTEGCTQILQSNSCDIIKIYNYESLIVACSKGTNMPAKYSS